MDLKLTRSKNIIRFQHAYIQWHYCGHALKRKSVPKEYRHPVHQLITACLYCNYILHLLSVVSKKKMNYTV